MRITREADYALRIVYTLAKSGEIMDARTIADKTNVSLRFALKILRKLAIGNMVKSYKGAHGGYKFLQKPEATTMLGVIELIDGPVAISRCIESDHECSVDKSECIFHGIFSVINRDVAKKLDKILISELISPEFSLDKVLDTAKSK